MPPEENTRKQEAVDADETCDHVAGLASSTLASHHRAAPKKPEVPGYTLAEQIGVGGMGVVYKATHLRFNRTVALKMIIGGNVVDERELRRFLVEVEAVAAIDHPNVVKVFDTGDTDGRPYLAMEYLPGGNLAQRLKKTARLEPRDAADLVRKLALAVQAAHDRQIVHRDLKPANVLFDAAGEPRVTDFGLAKKAGSGELTGTGAIMGTPAYMAPEQAKGESKFVGPQADVWALGVILYECLSGAKPFTGANEIEVIRNVVESEHSTLRSVAAATPKDLELITQKCLAKEPGGRYASANALAEDLQHWRNGEPVSVKAAGPVERTVKWVKRNKLATGILAASLIVAMITSTVSVIAYRENARANLKTAEAETNAGNAITQANRADANARTIGEKAREQRRVLDAMRIRESDVAFGNKLVQYARDTLEAVSDENRTSAWHLSRRLYEASDFTLYGHTGAVQSVAWSPDGRTLATGSFDQTVRLWDATTGQCLKVWHGHSSVVTSVAWSPDGNTLASGSFDQTVRLWAAATGQTAKVLVGHNGHVTCVAWSPDGRSLATGSADKTVRLWVAATGQCQRELNVNSGVVNAVAFSPDGGTLVTVSYDHSVRLWESTTGQDLMELKGHTGNVTCVSWSPDGRSLATAGGDRFTIVWDIASRKSIRRLLMDVTSLVVRCIAWSPDGRRLATAVDNGGLQVWDSATGEKIAVLQDHISPVSSLAWSPDSHHLATAGADSSVQIWNAATGQTPYELKAKAGEVFGVAWNPDSRRLATCSQNSNVRLWDAGTGQSLGEFAGHTGIVMCVAWSPDGRALATVGVDKIVRIWDTATGQCQKALKGHTGSVTSAVWSPDGRTLATASYDTVLRLWDTTTGQCVSQLKGHTNFLDCVAWSPDGRMLATASRDKTARLWDASTRQSRTVLTGHTKDVLSVAWSPDSRSLATGSADKAVRLWDASTGQCLTEIKGHTDAVTSVAWCTDGRTLATGSQDTTVRLWDAATGQSLSELKGHWEGLYSVAWSPDGRTLATGSRDSTVRLHLTSTGQSIRQLKGHTGTVLSVARSKDGTRIVSSAARKVPLDPKVTATIDERFVWDAGTCERLQDTPIPELADPDDPTDDGFLYIPSGNKILKVSKTMPPEEIARRKWVMDPKPDWHREQTAECEKQSNWFAAAFHLRRLAALEPKNAKVKARLLEVQKKLPREVSPLPNRAIP